MCQKGSDAETFRCMHAEKLPIFWKIQALILLWKQPNFVRAWYIPEAFETAGHFKNKSVNIQTLFDEGYIGQFALISSWLSTLMALIFCFTRPREQRAPLYHFFFLYRLWKLCVDCVDNKCRRCADGYALSRIYSRRFCVSTCPGNGVQVWDPVLRTDACDLIQGRFEFDWRGEN